MSVKDCVTSACTAATEAAADRVATGEDAAATAADRVQTGLDVVSSDSNANRAETALANIAATSPSPSLAIDNIAGLLAVAGMQDGQIANVSGYHTANDGGGGVFNYDASQSGVNNGGTIINGWILQHNGSVSLAQFGVIGDGSVSDVSKLVTASNYARGYGFKLSDELTASELIMPSVEFPIVDLDTQIDSSNIILGNAVLSGKTSIQKEIILETLLNGVGGTYSITPEIVALAEVDVNSGDAVQFTIVLDTNNISANVSVVGYGTKNPDDAVPTFGTIPLTESPAGTFKFGPWVPSPTSNNWNGFKVSIAYDNSASVEDYAIIKSMSLTQGGVDLLDFDMNTIDGNKWSECIPKTSGAYRTVATLNTLNRNIKIRAIQAPYGKSLKRGVVSPSGTINGEGTYDDPIDFETFQKLASNGYFKTSIFLSGVYQYDNSKHLSTAINVSEGSTVIGIGDVVIEGSRDMLSASFTLDGTSGLYKASYDPSNNYQASSIVSGVADPTMTGKNKSSFKKMNTLAECQSENKSYFWDSTTQEFFVNFDASTPIDCIVAEIKNGINLSNNSTVHNIRINGVTGYLAKADGINAFYLSKVTSDYGNGAGEMFDIDDASGFMLECDGSASNNDGFNFHGSGHTQLVNCTANDCIGDGASHHDDCTSIVYGGVYNNNGKGGVIPAFGATVQCVKVTATNNISGRDPLASDFNYGGFVCLADNAPTTVGTTSMACYRCVTDGNKFGYLSAGGDANLLVIDPILNNDEADFGNMGWSGKSAGVLEIQKAYNISSLSISSDDALKIKVR